MENVVFLELMRLKHYWRPGLEFYYRDARGEVDFVAKGERVELI